MYSAALTTSQLDAHWSIGGSPNAQSCKTSGASPYERTVLQDQPALYLQSGDLVSSAADRVAYDTSGGCRNGAYDSSAAAQAAGPIQSGPTAGTIINAGQPVVYASGDSLPAGNSARTLEFWMHTPDYREGDVTYGDFGVSFYFSYVGDLYAGPISVNEGSTLSESNTWHQYVATWDGSTEILYLDGVQIATATGSPFKTQEPGSALRVEGSSVGAFDVTQVAVYPSALSASRIAAHYAAARPAPPVGGAVTASEEAGGGQPICVSCMAHAALGTAAAALGDLAPHSLFVDPVDTASGNYSETFDDLTIPERGPAMGLSRTYNSMFASTNGPFGYGWTFSYGMSLSVNSQAGTAIVSQENGSTDTFTLSNGVYTAPPRILATLVQNGGGTYTYTRAKRTLYTFSSNGQLTQIADLNGNTTTLSYNGAGQLTTVTDQAGRVLKFAWTGSNVTGVTDPASRSLTFSYDGSGNLASVKDVGGGNTTFTYDSSHRLLTVTDPRSGVVTNSYDSQGRVSWQTDPMNRKTSFDYSSVGNATLVTDPKGNVTAEYYTNGVRVAETRGYGTSAAATLFYQYDPNTVAPAAVTDPDGHVTTLTYDSAGNVLTTTDALNRTTNNMYDTLGDLISTTDPNGVTTTYTYDSAGNLHQVSRPLTGTGQSQVTTYTYGNPVHPGDVTSVTDPNSKVTQYAYNGDGDLYSITDPLGDTTTYGFDAAGRVTSKVSPLGNVTGGAPSNYTWYYTTDAFGDQTSVTDPIGYVTSNQYDADRNLTKTTDANHNATTYTYDADNELTKVTRADNSTQQTGYDADGNVTSQTDGLGHAIAYAYDALNRRTSSTDPLNRTTAYGYDAAGNLTALLDAKGQTTTFAYDAANQLTSTTYSDGLTPKVGLTYDGDGQRKTMQDGTGTSSYSYDSLNRLMSMTNGAGATVGYGYDLKGQLTSIVYPGGTSTVTRTYDDVGRLASVTDWLSHTTRFQYDADSNLTTESYPNGTQTVRAHGSADRLTGITDSQGSMQFLSLSYSHDGLDQLTAENSQTYGYDANERLTGGGNRTYSDDAADRLTQIAVNGGNTSTMTYDAAGQVQSLTVTNGSTQVAKLTYGFDANGNRTSQTNQNNVTTTLGYDQANRLTSYGPATYAYNGDGLRVSKTVSGTTTAETWDVAEGLQLLIADGSLRYVTGPGGLPLEQVNADGSVWYFHSDQLGSTRALTDQSGSVVATYTYDAYGALTGLTGGASTSFRYAGQYQDAETGAYYLRARYYDGAGQFISRDPLAATTRQPYGYAVASPVNATDNSGLDAGSWLFGQLVDMANDPNNSLMSGVQGFADAVSGGAATPYLASQGSMLYTDTHAYNVGYGVGTAASIAMVIDTGGTDEVADASLIYSARVGIRELEDTGPYHNFPYLFDRTILSCGERTQVSEGYVRYTMPGSINGVSGTYEIGTRPSALADSEVVIHRLFRPQ